MAINLKVMTVEALHLASRFVSPREPKDADGES